MTLEQIITELCESGATYECNRSLFAFINRCLNERGAMAKVTELGDMIAFSVERKLEH